MDQLDLIKTAHVIDDQLGRLAAAVTDEALKSQVLTMQERWRELAYQITAELCGVESSPSPGSAKKRRRRKRSEVPAEQADYPDGESPEVPGNRE
ncbi:MAG: hypothetical protein ACE5JQ_00700 [Candidatus Methylomirabilales bacterium]